MVKTYSVAITDVYLAKNIAVFTILIRVKYSIVILNYSWNIKYVTAYKLYNTLCTIHYNTYLLICN